MLKGLPSASPKFPEAVSAYPFCRTSRCSSPTTLLDSPSLVAPHLGKVFILNSLMLTLTLHYFFPQPPRETAEVGRQSAGVKTNGRLTKPGARSRAHARTYKCLFKIKISRVLSTYVLVSLLYLHYAQCALCLPPFHLRNKSLI